MNGQVLERTGVSLERLRSFLSVVDAAGIARAAPGQPARQSLYSRQIGELEAALEVVLFERKGRQLLVTEAGRQLATVVRDALHGIETVAQTDRQVPRPFTLAAGDSLLHWWVIPRLGGHLLKDGARVEALSSKDAAAAVYEGRLDFAVVRLDADLHGLEQSRIGLVEYAVFASAQLARGASSSPVALARLPFALQTSEPSLNEGLVSLMRRAGPQQPALFCETFPQVCRAVQAGRYAGLLPTLARAELPARRFRELEFPGQLKLRTAMALVWRKKALVTRPEGERLVALLASQLKLPA